MGKNQLISDRGLTGYRSGSGLYSLRSGQAPQTPGPTPGINTPGAPMMTSAPPVQQQNSNMNNMLALLKNLGSIKAAGGAGTGAGTGAGETTPQQSTFNLGAWLSGLFGKNTTGGQAGI